MGLFSNKENDLQSFEQTIEKLRADYARLEQENIAKSKEIEQLRNMIESLNSNSPQDSTAIVDQVVNETQPSHEPETAVAVDYTPQLDAINASINELKEMTSLMKTELTYRDTQDENMKAMHKELEKFRGNFYAKITQPYMMAMLDMHKRFFESYAHFDHLDNTATDMTQLYNDLMEQFKSAVDALESRIYNDFGVEYYLPEVGVEFNPKAHQAFEVISTEDPEQNRKVAKVIYGGFRDIESEKILRPARIACYKYLSATE